MSRSDWPVTVDPDFGCHLYDGPTDRDGYGRVGRQLAHVVAWEAELGPVPEGLELSHECMRRRCCNPAHLRPVSHTENIRLRSWGYRSRVKRCKAGHDMKLHAMILPGGGRACRACTFGVKP